MLKILAVLLSLQTVLCGLFGRSKNVKTLKTVDQIQKVFTQNNIVSVFFYLGKNCENCGNAWNLIEKLADENEGVLKVYDIDCDELWSDQYSRAKYYLCDPSTRKQLPQVMFYQPPTRKYNPYTKQPMEPSEHRFQGEANPKALAQFGHKLLPAFRIRINNTEDYEEFLQREPKLNKVILFTEKKVTAAIFKGLSIHYYKRLYLGEVAETPETNDLLDEFEIDEFPQVFLLIRNEDGSYTRELYEGDVIWDRLVRYLDQYAAPEPVELEHPEIFEPPEEAPSDKKRRKREQQQQRQQSQEKSATSNKPSALVEIQSQADIEEHCEKKSTSCFLGLLNGMNRNTSKGDGEKSKWDRQMEIMEKVKDRFSSRPATFVFIDAGCHDEVLHPLDISEDALPNFVQLLPSKKQFAKLIGSFDIDSLTRFGQNALKGRSALFNLPNGLQIQERNCSEVLEQRAKSRESSGTSEGEDDILKEILEEERRKKDQIEKELKAEKKNGKKKKGKQDKEEL